MEAAADRADDAIEVAFEVAADLGLYGDPVVLHRSNNVVVRVADLVIKVGRVGATDMQREVAVATFGAARGAPVLSP